MQSVTSWGVGVALNWTEDSRESSSRSWKSVRGSQNSSETELQDLEQTCEQWGGEVSACVGGSRGEGEGRE